MRKLGWFLVCWPVVLFIVASVPILLRTYGWACLPLPITIIASQIAGLVLIGRKGKPKLVADLSDLGDTR